MLFRSLALVNFAWVLFDLWQICFVNTLPEIRFEGSRKKAALVVFVYLSIAAVLAVFFIRNYGA